MHSFLKNHPFPVEAHFESSIVLTFAFKKENLLPLLPDKLELDTFQDKWGFVAIAMVQTKDLRPKGFPRFMGSDFFLIGYRIFVRHNTIAGKNLRGLYIIKSETDKKRMEILGNIFSHYNYATTDIQTIQKDHELTIQSENSKFRLVVDTAATEVALPQGSPFKDWKEARRFAGPLPFTFTFNKQKQEMLIIEGVRENWVPEPMCVVDFSFPYLKTLKAGDFHLANAFVINNIPYYWKKGRTEQW